MNHRVLVHKDEKSTVAKIRIATKMDRAFLMPISQEVSRISFDIHNTLDNIQDMNLGDKIQALIDGVEAKIYAVKSKIKKILF